jgi:ribosomal-protein-alanine N-acetyltransferase
MALIQLIKILEDGSVEGRIPTDGLTQEVCQATSEIYKARGYEEPWLSYLALADGHCVGTCRFGAPPEFGRIEISCHTFPEYEGRGVGTAMATALVEMALRQNRDIEIAAYTVPKMGAPTRVLEKLGFRFVGLVGHQEEGEVWEWVYSRAYH